MSKIEFILSRYDLLIKFRKNYEIKRMMLRMHNVIAIKVEKNQTIK